MGKQQKIIAAMNNNPAGVRFADLKRVCDDLFGTPRNKGTSHYVYKMPWAGDPRVLIQEGNGGKAKPYQVRQVLQAIEKLEGE